MVDQPDPDVWNAPAMRAALARRDIAAVYWRLRGYGFSQRMISDLTGQSQSEVCEIVKGREVQKVTTLERIADGLGVPRGYMGLAFNEDPTYLQDQGEPVGDEVDEDMKRRTAVLNFAAAVMFGRPLLGEVVAIGAPVVEPVLPTRLVASDVTALKALTRELRKLGRAGHGGMPDVLGQVATWAERKLKAPAVDTPTTLQAYHSALAELHTLAGWCCYDMAQIDQSRWHYSRAVELAGDAGDVTEMASGLLHAAIGRSSSASPTTRSSSASWRRSSSVRPRTPPLANSSTRRGCTSGRRGAYADLGRPDLVQNELTKARDLPELADPFERASLASARGATYLILGNVNVAESSATTAIRTWDSNDLRESVYTRILLARIHLQAREPGVERLAAPAINAVAELRSARARTRLTPLEDALRARGDSTSADLAEKARQVRQGLIEPHGQQ